MSRQTGGATRDLTSKFHALKRSESDDSKRSQCESGVPASVKLIMTTQEQIKITIGSLDQFDEKQKGRNMFQMMTPTEQTQHTRELQAISAMVRTCHRNILELKSQYGNDRVVSNALRAMSPQLQHIAQRLRKSESWVVEEIEYTRDLQPISSSSENYVQLLAEDEEDERKARERLTEIKKIATEVDMISQMVRDLDLIIIDQGTVVDRIESHIVEAKVKVTQGREELVTANAHQRSASSLSNKLMGMLAVGVIVFSTLIGIKAKK